MDDAHTAFKSRIAKNVTAAPPCLYNSTTTTYQDVNLGFCQLVFTKWRFLDFKQWEGYVQNFLAYGRKHSILNASLTV